MGKEIDHADRGLIPAYPFSTKRSVVYGDYYIEKHRYRTNRNTIIEIWDVYLGTDLLPYSGRLKSFSTLKAAKEYCAMRVGSQNNNINNPKKQAS
jgi:hypothetical protein